MKQFPYSRESMRIFPPKASWTKHLNRKKEVTYMKLFPYQQSMRIFPPKASWTKHLNRKKEVTYMK